MRHLSLGAAALVYAARGWHVFPLQAKGKVPPLGGGVYKATTDAKVVAAWWKAMPTANIGIGLRASKLACIDLDVKPDKGIDGRLTFKAMCAIYGRPGACAIQRTASGGIHYVFAPRKGVQLLDKVKFEDGVDILTAKHRYIVAAPSVTPKGSYAWHDGQLEPWDEVGSLAAPWAELLRAKEPRSEQEPRPAPSTEHDLLDIASLRVPGVDMPELDSILAVLDPSMERDSWLRVLWGAAAQWARTPWEKEVIHKLEEWSAGTDKDGQYKPGEVAERWAEHTASVGGKSGAGHVTWRSVRVLAQDAGWSPFSMGGVDPKSWKKYLKVKNDERSGRPMALPTAWNAALLLAYHPKLANCLRRNVLTNDIEIHKPIICPMRDPTRLPKAFNKDADWVGIGKALEPAVMGALSQTTIVAAAINAAEVHSYDPIKNWLDALAWDGVPRLDTWLTSACHAKDDALTRAIGRAWMIGLAARASTDYEGKGTKMDSVLVLQGPEGIGKSTVGAIIGGDWYASFSNSLQNDEIYYVIEKSIVLEFEELDAISRSEASRVKALVTTQADTFRRKWGSSAQGKPRRCVFLGTVNDETFLTKDMTMRRWWVVRCPARRFNLKWLSQHRDQLVAEAKTALERGEIPVLPEAVRGDHRVSVEHARIEHPYEDSVKTWTAKQTTFAVVGINAAVEAALGRQASSLNMHELRRFGECMRYQGWTKRRRSDGNCWVLEKL